MLQLEYTHVLDENVYCIHKCRVLPDEVGEYKSYFAELYPLSLLYPGSLSSHFKVVQRELAVQDISQFCLKARQKHKIDKHYIFLGNTPPSRFTEHQQRLICRAMWSLVDWQMIRRGTSSCQNVSLSLPCICTLRTWSTVFYEGSATKPWDSCLANLNVDPRQLLLIDVQALNGYLFVQLLGWWQMTRRNVAITRDFQSIAKSTPDTGWE